MAENKSGRGEPPVIDMTARHAGPAPAPESEPLGENSADAPDGASEPESGRRIDDETAVIRAGGDGLEPAEPFHAMGEAEPAYPASGPQDGPVPPSEAPAASRLSQDAAALPPRPARTRLPLGALLLTMLLGALLGAALSYGLARYGWFPQTVAAAPDNQALEQRLAALESRDTAAQQTIEDLSSRLVAVETAEPPAPAIAPALEAEDVAALRGEVQALSVRLDEVAAGVPAAAAAPPDLAPLTSDVAALQETIAPLAEGIAALEETTAPLGREIDRLGENLSAIDQRLGALETRQQDSETALADLGSAFEQAQAERAAAAAEPDPAIERAARLKDLEAAVASGGAFAGELSGLIAAAPGLSVPDPVRADAERGVPTSSEIQAALADAVPAMLAARPTAPDASWQQGAADWLTGLLAIRPIGEAEGNAPDAVLSRLEAAVERGDLAAAGSLLSSLPDPMAAAAGDVPEMIAARLRVDAFVGGLEAEIAAAGENAS